MNSKDEYVENLKLKLDEWNARLDELDAKARQSQAQAMQKTNSQLAELRRKRDDLQARLGELQAASADSWATLQAGADELWDDLQRTLAASKEAFVHGREEAKK